MSRWTKRKYVEKETEEYWVLPEENQTIVKVVKPWGDNTFQVVTPEGEGFLVLLPRKFRAHVFVLRGHYVVIDPVQGAKVKGEIARVLQPKNIKYLQEMNKWPSVFEIEEDEPREPLASASTNPPETSSCEEEEDSDDEDDLLQPNLNGRVVYVDLESSSELEEESEEEDSSDSEEREESADEEKTQYRPLRLTLHQERLLPTLLFDKHNIY